MADIEIYTKDWCPYCAKAKALLKSKGLSYKEINVTTDHDLQQKMIERSGRRTVPQIFIDGESMGGYDDLANLNATGELDRKLEIKPEKDLNKLYDVAIIGAGPAGLAAAVYAIRKNLFTVIISSDIGGQLGITYEVANYPGFQLITGPDLVQKFSEHVEQYGIERLVGEKVTGIELDGRAKRIKTASGKEICTKTVIIATGTHKRELNIPGEKELAGKGVVYCSTCDGPLFRDLTIAIVGGGNAGLEAALEMDDVAKKVYLISRYDWTGDEILQDKIAVKKNLEVLKYHEPVELHGKDRVEGITVRNNRTGKTKRLDVDGVFIEIGLFPNTDFVLDLVETNELGEIIVDNHGQTGVRGIFAAGDAIESHDKQVIIAAGEGARAALGAFEYIIKQV
ncbi:glutaredoxin 3 [Desulfobacterota bacterium AH_259_B03_O07]|nr:glutaredoxin 3 [Desulfobacterota bacterium AH_259_B03_O07]